MNSFIRMVRRADQGLAAFESALLVVVVAVMLVLAVTQVILKIAHAGVEQVEMSARYLVIWVAFLGGAVATYQVRHINIDVLNRFVGMTGRRVAGVVINLVALGLIGVLLAVVWSYVADMRADGRVAIEFTALGGTWRLMSWWFASIMPVGLALMACHFLTRAILHASGTLEGEGGTEAGVDDAAGGAS